MRKSIKKIAASLLAATMVIGSCVSAFGYTAENGTITDVNDGEVVYVFAGAATGWGDGLKLESSMFTQAEGLAEGVLTKKVTMTNEGEWTRRFSICGITYNEATGDETLGSWARQILGEPGYTPMSTITCASTIALDSIEAETEVTVYYDTRTSTVCVTDAEGKEIPYTVYWMSNDRDEGKTVEGTDYKVGYTIDELAAMTYDEFVATLSDDRKGDLDIVNGVVTLEKNMFKGGKYVDNYAGLKAYVAGGEDYVKKAEEPSTEAPKADETTAAPKADETTAAPTTAAPTTAAPTTAANQSTKTGDVAPVALMVVLFSAVAVVAVAAKKKEA